MGPPVIGGIVGGLVGDRMGEHGAEALGINEAASNVGDRLAKVVGKRNADKIGEITLT